MIAPPEVRAAKDTLAEHRKAVRKARPPKVRPDAPGQRRVRERDPGFLAFVRRLPCAVGEVGCFGPVEAAHVRYGRPGEGNAGLQRKPSDRNAVPLCAGHHRDGPDAQHKSGERQWWATRGIDPHALADRLWHAYWRSTDSQADAAAIIHSLRGLS